MDLHQRQRKANLGIKTILCGSNSQPIAPSREEKVQQCHIKLRATLTDKMQQLVAGQWAHLQARSPHSPEQLKQHVLDILAATPIENGEKLSVSKLQSLLMLSLNTEKDAHEEGKEEQGKAAEKSSDDMEDQDDEKKGLEESEEESGEEGSDEEESAGGDEESSEDSSETSETEEQESGDEESDEDSDDDSDKWLMMAASEGKWLMMVASEGKWLMMDEEDSDDESDEEGSGKEDGEQAEDKKPRQSRQGKSAK